MTCHKAQGATVDIALLYGAGALSREAGYVALSRGRTSNHLYVPNDHDNDRTIASRTTTSTSTGSPRGSPSATPKPSPAASCRDTETTVGSTRELRTSITPEPKGYHDEQ